jgi:hypothetical protein
LKEKEAMMYSNKLAIAVKSNGKVLREFGETVYVPFGTEYTLLIKNLNSVRAQVRVSIDGQDATEGCSLVIGPNSEMELERFIKSGNMNKGNRFKFIERTAGVEAHRGIGVTDGLIRIEYEFEKPYVAPVITTTYWPTKRWVKKEYWDWEDSYADKATFTAEPSRGILRSSSMGSASLSSQSGDASFAATKSASVAASGSSVFLNQVSGEMAMAQNAISPTMDSYSPKEVENEAGITVAGSMSDQRFTSVGWFSVEATTHSMVIKLLGETETGKPVVKPVTVKTKNKCTTCGRVNKASAKFCDACGTSLEIVS